MKNKTKNRIIILLLGFSIIFNGYLFIENAQFKKIVALSNLIQRRYHNDIRNMLP